MKRTFVRLAVCCTACVVALASTAHAGDHGKSKRSNFSQSGGGGGGNGGGGGGNSGGNGPSMKLYSYKARNLSSLSNNNGGGNGGSSSLNPSFSRKMNKSFAQMQQGNGSLPTVTSNQNLKFSKSLNGQSSGNPFANQTFNPNGRARRTQTGDGIDTSQFAEAVKKGKFRPIDSGIGNGTGIGTTGGIETKPRKFQPWNPEKIADVIKHEGNLPLGDVTQIGDKKFDFDKKFSKDKKFDGNWNDKFGGQFGNQFCDTPNQNKNKDCHNGFPWWKLWTNCYPNNCYPNNCYPNNWHNHYSNNCYPPIYYNYPPVTNVTVVNQTPELPPQPTLVQGIDLELVDLRLVDMGDAAKNLGPRYRITYRNRGTQGAGNFQVMLLASSDGTPQPGLPSGIAEVAGAAPGQLLTVDVRLALTPDLGTLNNLIVALDTATQVSETEESNNVAVIDRTKVTMADLAVR